MFGFLDPEAVRGLAELPRLCGGALRRVFGRAPVDAAPDPTTSPTDHPRDGGELFRALQHRRAQEGATTADGTEPDALRYIRTRTEADAFSARSVTPDPGTEPDEKEN